MKISGFKTKSNALTTRILSLLIVGVGALNASAVTNLILNGSFELGKYSENSFVPTRMQLGDGSTVIDNWVVGATTGNFWWVGAPNNAQDGVFSADLDSNGNTPTYIEQSFATTAGSQYVVTASFSSEGNGGPAVTAVSINGSLLGTATTGAGIGEAGPSYLDLVWTTKSFPFTATSATATLRFQDATADGQFYNPLVDNVSVIQVVPEQSLTKSSANSSTNSLHLIVSAPPALYISGNQSLVTVFWRDVPGWSLQQNGDLMMPAAWSLNDNAMLSGGTNYLMLSNAPGTQFYRLNHP